MSWQRSVPAPALVVRPRGAASLDEAHAAIEQWEHYSGKPLDPPQRLAVELMMAEDASSRWAARTTGRTMSRQNGKGDEIEVVEAWGLTQRGEAIVHTAHEIPTAKSAHARLVGHLEGHKDLRRLVKQVRYANGDQSIEMHNGGIVVYRTRTSGGGRGLDDISRLVVDEAQHAQPEQLASSTPILAANPNPQTNFIGSAGISGKSQWWWEMRKRALLPEPGAFAWLEHSAERITLDADGRVLSTRPDVWDRKAWRDANPAYPRRIEPEFLEEQLRTLGPELFAREHLGVWDPDLGPGGPSVFPPGVWEAVNHAEVAQPTEVTFSLDVNPERTAAAIGVAGAGGACGLVDRRPGVGWAVDEVVAVAGRHGARVAVVSNSPAGALIAELERAGATVVALPLGDYRDACGAFFDAVTERRVVVQRHPDLDAAVTVALKKSAGDGFVWDRRAGDVSPLVALTIAYAVAQRPVVSAAPLVMMVGGS
jgi:hypothetical protein